MDIKHCLPIKHFMYNYTKSLQLNHAISFLKLHSHGTRIETNVYVAGVQIIQVLLT